MTTVSYLNEVAYGLLWVKLSCDTLGFDNNFSFPLFQRVKTLTFYNLNFSTENMFVVYSYYSNIIPSLMVKHLLLPTGVYVRWGINKANISNHNFHSIPLHFCKKIISG